MTTSTAPRLQPVYASVNRPLTIGGADRRLFFVAVVVGGAVGSAWSVRGRTLTDFARGEYNVRS